MGVIAARTAAYVSAGGPYGGGESGRLLGSGSLAVTHNAGGTWTKVPVPPSSESIADVALLSTSTAAITGTPGAVAITGTTLPNGAASWQTRTLPVGVPVQPAQVVADNGALAGIFVTEVGPSSLPGLWLSSSDGGVIWRQHRTPVQGVVTSARGERWLAGGVGDSALHMSSDDGTSWHEASVRTTVGSPQQAAALSPVQADGGDVVFAATGAHTTQMITGTTTGATGAGWSWVARPPLDLDGSYGPGVPARASSAAAGVLWILSPANNVARVNIATGQVRATQAAGLPAGGTVALFATSATAAWPEYTTYTCALPRSDCVPVAGLIAISDGGQTWTALAIPSVN